MNKFYNLNLPDPQKGELLSIKDVTNLLRMLTSRVNVDEGFAKDNGLTHLLDVRIKSPEEDETTGDFDEDHRTL